MKGVVVSFLATLTSLAYGDPAPKPAATQLPIGHVFFEDMCSRSSLCLRFKLHYSEIRPDRAIIVGRLTNENGDEAEVTPAGGSIADNRFAVVVASMVRPPVVPTELSETVAAYLVSQGVCSRGDESCLLFGWTTTNRIYADDRNPEAHVVTEDPDNQLTAVGTRSVLTAVTDTPGPTIALFAKTSEPTDLEDDYVLDRFARRFADMPGVKSTKSTQGGIALLSITADTPDEFGGIVAYVARDPLDARKKFFKTERFSIEKAPTMSAGRQIAAEAREAWKRYWFKKLQTQKLDEVVQYLIMQSEKQLGRGEFANAHSSLASAHYFAPELSPETQDALGAAILKVEDAAAADLKKKREQLEAEKKAAEERQRAYAAYLKKRSSPRERARRELCYVTLLLSQKRAALAYEDEVERESGITDLKLRHDLGEDIVALEHGLQPATKQFLLTYSRSMNPQTDCTDVK